jgi:CRP/FNR family transcriptional regulator, cyclic AMP receptor protein
MKVLGLQTLIRYREEATARDWANVLATFPLFASISKRRLRKLVEHATITEFAPGETVVAAGASANSFYIILGGSAAAQGKPAARPLRTGDYFGELALVDGLPRSASVVATSELHVLSLSQKSFLRLAKHDPAISLTMLRNLGAQFRRLEAQTARP